MLKIVTFKPTKFFFLFFPAYHWYQNKTNFLVFEKTSRQSKNKHPFSFTDNHKKSQQTESVVS